ncbi:MAG TPA: hypothetical protein VN673_13935 [Clostridia bacterium]|nr:hypothetical protein [Clostridia bacterium]
MKTVAYSEVPKASSYVHLAYLSAGSAKLVNDAFLSSGMLMGAVSLLALIVGSKFKLGAKAPRLWRLTIITLVTATVFVLVVALISVPPKTRGM